MPRSPFTIQAVPWKKPIFRLADRILYQRITAYNRRQAGPTHLKEFFVVAKDSKGRYIGGLRGFIYWGWLYISLSWVDRGWRGRGLGRRLMRKMEATARRRGCSRAFTESWSFQAPSFYRKLGYRCYTQLKGFPPGHTLHFFHKSLDHNRPHPENRVSQPVITIKTVFGPKQRLCRIHKILGRRLNSFIRRKTGSLHYEEFGFMAMDGKNNPIGGLIGNIFGRWAHIDILWVDPKFRRKGLGRKLLLATEREARKRGCGNIQLRAYSFQTLAFFKKMGFRPYGRLPHLPEGHTRIYLYKKLMG